MSCRCRGHHHHRGASGHKDSSSRGVSRRSGESAGYPGCSSERPKTGGYHYKPSTLLATPCGTSQAGSERFLTMTESRRIGQGAWMGEAPTTPRYVPEPAHSFSNYSRRGLGGRESLTSRSTRPSEMDMMAMRVRELGSRPETGRYTDRSSARRGGSHACGSSYSSSSSACDSLPLGAEWCTF